MTYITHHDPFTERDEQSCEREREAREYGRREPSNQKGKTYLLVNGEWVEKVEVERKGAA